MKLSRGRGRLRNSRCSGAAAAASAAVCCGLCEYVWDDDGIRCCCLAGPLVWNARPGPWYPSPLPFLVRLVRRRRGGGSAEREDAEYGDVRPIINLRRRDDDATDRPTDRRCFERETVCRILPEENARPPARARAPKNRFRGGEKDSLWFCLRIEDDDS